MTDGRMVSTSDGSKGCGVEGCPEHATATRDVPGGFAAEWVRLCSTHAARVDYGELSEAGDLSLRLRQVVKQLAGVNAVIKALPRG